MPKAKLKSIKTDLCKKKPPAFLLELGNTTVEFQIEIETKKPNTAKLDRYDKVAAAEVKRYADTIESEVERLTKDIQKLSSVVRNPDEPQAKREKAKKEAQTKAAETTKSVQNACKAMQSAVEVAVQTQIKKEAQGDKNLLEARVFVVIKGAFGVIKVGKDVTEIVLTGGADVKAWISLAKDLAGIAKLVYDQTKDEAKLRQELLKSIGEYCSLKQRRFDEKKKADGDWKKKLKVIAKDIYKSEGKMAKKAEVARKKYRNSVTKMRQSVDTLGGKVDKAKSSLSKAPNIIKGAPIGAKMIEMQTKAKALNDTFLAAQEFADDMAFLLTEAGVTVDDRTEAQKLKSLSNLPDALKAAKELKTAADNIVTIVEALS